MTPAPDISALAEACDASILVLSAKLGSTESGIYILCADGSFMQQIVSTEIDLPDTRPNRFLAISPDGQKLAFDAGAEIAGSDIVYQASIYVLDFSDYSLTEVVYSDEFLVADIDWSPDGEYLGYINYFPFGIEILHIASQTTSQIITDRRSFEERIPGFVLKDFDWSPDGTKINYRLDPPYPPSRDDLPDTSTWYVEDITCDPQTHTCSLSNQRILGWPNNTGYRLSWVPDSSQLLGIGFDSVDSTFTEIRELSGALNWQIELENLSPSQRGGDFRDAVLSSDGKHIAFIAKDTSGNDIYVLSLEDMSLLNVTDLMPYRNYYQVEWLPDRP